MRSIPSGPALARLILKAQNEFNGLVGLMHPAVRLAARPSLDFRLGNLHFALGARPQAPSAVQLTCSTDDKFYIINLATEPAFDVSATLVDRATGDAKELDMGAVLRGDVPKGFEALHEEVLTSLREFLPSELLAQFKSVAAGGTKADAPTTSASAEAPVAPGSEPVQEPAAPEYQSFVITRVNEPDLRFTGKLLDAVRTSTRDGRWTEFHVYETRGGKFIGVKLGRSLWFSEVDRQTVEVADSLEGLVEFFGHSTLAKALTTRLGVQQYFDVE